MNMIQIGMTGVLGVLLAVQFKGAKTEYGIYMSVAVSLLLFLCIVDRLKIFVRTIDELGHYIHAGSGYFSIMLKMIGITYISEFSSAICKDAGYQTVAVQIEIFSKLTILAMEMPILLALLETIQEFLV